MNEQYSNRSTSIGTMFMVKKIFVGIFLANLTALFVLYYSKLSEPSENIQAEALTTTVEIKSNDYSFDHPLLAHHLLKYFDEYEEVELKYNNHLATYTNLTHKGFIGLFIDDNYCDKQRMYFVSDPRSVFEDTNACMDMFPYNFFRNQTRLGILEDLQPQVNSLARDKRFAWLDVRHQHFFIFNILHVYQALGKNFGCLTQSYNHIPGHGYLNRKDLVFESITTYAKKYQDKPQCFSFDRAFPRTWVMYLKDQCKDFFKSFKSEEYANLKAKNGIVYIKKIGAGSHNGKGVFLMDPAEEKKVIDFYQNGEKCGIRKDNFIIQYFVPNPLLLYGHKFDFRIYLLVASIDPLMAYYYDGYLKVSLQKYEPHSGDVYSMITNTHVSTDFIKKATNGTLVSGMNETELQYFQRWDFERFEKYMLSEKKVSDPNWLDNYLRPEFKRAMIHLIRMTQHQFLKRSQIYELFGVDFMLDEDLNLWFIECNSSPSLSPTYPESAIFIKKHVKDLFEIVIGLTRSRVKRIIRFINDITKNNKSFGIDIEGRLEVDALLIGKKEEFKKILKNSFEEEFLPGPDNNYKMIIDEHLDGSSRYMGILQDECL